MLPNNSPPHETSAERDYLQFSNPTDATPLSLVLADTGAVSSTDSLLQHITELTSDSAACIFDVTGGNPNVSLEVGIAHTVPAEYLLCVKTRKQRTQVQREAELDAKREGEVKAIISDLQRKNRVEYKTYAVVSFPVKWTLQR